MKKYLLFILVIVSKVIAGQTEITIHFVTDEKVDSLKISSLTISHSIKSEVENGLAYIEIPTITSDQYTFRVNDYKSNCWLNSGKIEVYLVLHEGKLSISKVINSPIFYVEREYRTRFNLYKNNSESESESHDKFIWDAIIENDQDAFILVPVNDFIKLNQNNTNTLLDIKIILNNQAPEIKEHIVFGMINQRLDKLIIVDSISLKSYSLLNRNNAKEELKIDTSFSYIILDFWFTSCPPCIRDHEIISTNFDQLNTVNAELIGISNDDDFQKWINYLNSKSIRWKNYRIGNCNIQNDLAIWSFPTYVVLDQNGNIIGSYSSFEETINSLKP